MKIGFKELFLFMLLLAIPVGAYFWIFEPAKKNVRLMEEQLVLKQKKLTELKEAMAGVKNLHEEVDNLSEAVSFFESKLPGQHEIHKVLQNVTQIAKRHHLETQLFKTLKSKPFAGYCEQPIRMEVYGDFDSYYQFLLDVEKMPRITKIKEMELEKDSKNEGAMKANFTMSIYFDQNVQAES